MIKINKKKIVCAIIMILIVCVFFILASNVEIEKIDDDKEINIAQEISEDDEKQINFVGYVLNTDSSTIEKKIFIINQYDVVNDMYKNILNKLIQKNEEEALKTVNEIYEISVNRCEEDKGILSVYLNNDILEFENLDIKDREYIIKMINNTMLEINEITNIRYFFNDKEYIANNV